MVTINEIFYSVQGESTYAGRPCVFVRLTACDLRCSWCDTPYAFYEGRKRAIDDVVAEVERYDCSLVEVTGGEPLLQEDVYPLMNQLVTRGKTVLLETGGHRSTARVPDPVITILDIKSRKIVDPAKLHHVQQELAGLLKVRERIVTSAALLELTEELRAVNESLWEIEDRIRERERAQNFGPDFIELARSVYLTNDRRASLKRRINELLASITLADLTHAESEVYQITGVAAGN